MVLFCCNLIFINHCLPKQSNIHLLHIYLTFQQYWWLKTSEYATCTEINVSLNIQNNDWVFLCHNNIIVFIEDEITIQIDLRCQFFQYLSQSVTLYYRHRIIREKAIRITKFFVYCVYWNNKRGVQYSYKCVSNIKRIAIINKNPQYPKMNVMFLSTCVGYTVLYTGSNP